MKELVIRSVEMFTSPISHIFGQLQWRRTHSRIWTCWQFVITHDWKQLLLKMEFQQEEDSRRYKRWFFKVMICYGFDEIFQSLLQSLWVIMALKKQQAWQWRVWKGESDWWDLPKLNSLVVGKKSFYKTKTVSFEGFKWIWYLNRFESTTNCVNRRRVFLWNNCIWIVE